MKLKVDHQLFVCICVCATVHFIFSQGIPGNKGQKGVKGEQGVQGVMVSNFSLYCTWTFILYATYLNDTM